MSDLDMPEIFRWQRLERLAHETFALYGYHEVRTPLVEREELFLRSLGAGTDVVRKEMYAFEDRGGRRLALRPEGTAGVLRYAAGLGAEAAGSKLYYLGPMFRAERPQAGRRRQFHQFGAEALGPRCAAADAECIALQAQLLERWGLSGCRFLLNTRGNPDEAEAVSSGLRKALQPSIEELCSDCCQRLQTNVLRVLDCKQPACHEVAENLPAVTDFMSADSRDYLDEVLHWLEDMGVAAERQPRLVRGLDYYAHTVWEVTHEGLGAQDALAGGGRYQVLLGKQKIEGVGFAIGAERALAALEAEGHASCSTGLPAPVWMVTQGAAAFEENLKLVQTVRKRGIACVMDLEQRSVKAQLRAAGRARAQWVLIRGDEEVRESVFCLKNMKTGSQERHPVSQLVACLEACGAHAPGRIGTAAYDHENTYLRRFTAGR